MVGIIQADRTIDFYFDELARLRQQYVINGAICVLFGIFLSWLFSVYATRPLKTLLSATRAFGGGDYGYQISDRRIDDFDYIFQDFNKMASKVNEVIEENLAKAQQISGLNRELQTSLAETQKSLEIKNEFLANMSHEIRTPMTSILGFTRVLLKKEHKKETAQLLRRVRGASENLMRIVDQILDLSKIESGKMELHNEEYDLYQELVELVMMNGERAAERHIDIILKIPRPIPNPVFGDCMRTSEVILNLLSNSIKFTHKGYVRITVN